MLVRLLIAATVLGTSTARGEDPCASDVKQFCAEVKPGAGRVERCLRENRKAITLACSEKLDTDEKKARALLEEFSLACQVDIGRHCSEVKPGEGRMIACLMKNQDDLSKGCKVETERFESAREKVLAVRSACRADVQRLCPGVPEEAGPLVACLQARNAELSAGCRAADPGLGAKAAELVDAIDALSSKERIMETLEILQGLDSVAFSRSQIALQGENFQAVGGVANSNRFTLNPQFVFGHRNQFAILIKVPVVSVYPYSTEIPAASGLGDLTTAFGWSFYARGQIRQYLALGLQWNTAAQSILGAPWALEPTYAIAIGLARWVSLTTELTWVRSLGSTGVYAELNILVLRPIFVFGLPANSFLALDTRLSWDLTKGTFVPVLKLAAGKFIDRGKSFSISAWYQASLTDQSQWQAFPGGFKSSAGVALAYFFDW